MVGWMYILKCDDGSYYTGSTKDLNRRLEEHEIGEGSNYTKKRLPVELVYFEKFNRIDFAFNREKQIQGWSRRKKEALIFTQNIEELNIVLKEYSECKNWSSHKNRPFGTSAALSNHSAQGPEYQNEKN